MPTRSHTQARRQNVGSRFRDWKPRLGGGLLDLLLSSGRFRRPRVVSPRLACTSRDRCETETALGESAYALLNMAHSGPLTVNNFPKRVAEVN